MPCSCQEVETAYSLTQWLSLAAAAASRSDQPIAFGSAVIRGSRGSDRFGRAVFKASAGTSTGRKKIARAVATGVAELLSQPVLHKVSHEESHPSLHEESQSSSQTNWNGFKMITGAVYSRVILWEQSAEHCRSRLGLTRWLTRRTHSHTPAPHASKKRVSLRPLHCLGGATAAKFTAKCRAIAQGIASPRLRGEGGEQRVIRRRRVRPARR